DEAGRPELLDPAPSETLRARKTEPRTSATPLFRIGREVSPRNRAGITDRLAPRARVRCGDAIAREISNGERGDQRERDPATLGEAVPSQPLPHHRASVSLWRRVDRVQFVRRCMRIHCNVWSTMDGLTYAFRGAV